MKNNILSAVIISLLLTGCGNNNKSHKITKTWLTMGTVATITLSQSDTAQIEKALSICEKTTEELNNTLSIFIPDSNLSKLNNANGGWVELKPATKELLILSRKYNKISHGVFDPTVSDLVKLWGFNTKEHIKKIPPQKEIDEIRQRCGIQNIIISNNFARIKNPGIKIDLGGIAKGYAVDCCFNKLRQNGLTNFIINIGGNLRVSGRASAERSWIVGVQNPFDKKKILGKIKVPSGWALATSGNYERFEYINGKRYAHIIDPRTGYPVMGMAGTTVISSKAVETDAMSTILYILQVKEGTEVLKQTPDCRALFVPDKKPVHLIVTPGFADVFTPLPEYSDVTIHAEDIY